MANDCWYVYVLWCADNTLYTGITTDLERRLQQHNGDLAGGARYTSSRRPVRMVYRERHSNRSNASQREWAIKAYSREQKLALVKTA